MKLIFASDFAPIRRFAPLMLKQPTAVYGDLLERLQKADYRIVNLECPLWTGERYITKSGAAFSGIPEHIGALTAGGFQAAILANNHTFDSGESGFRFTRDLLSKNGIHYVGAGATLRQARQPMAIDCQGVRILVLAISEGEDMQGATARKPGVRGWDVLRMAADIRRAKGHYDAILISAHCGLEYQPFPSYYVYAAFRKWAEAGADLIIGHHPHVPQGMTIFGKCPAYFSLGNFAFYQETPLYYRKIGYLLEMEITHQGVESHRPIPYRIQDTGLSLLHGDELREFRKLFTKLSRPLKTPRQALAAWHAVLAANGVEGFRQELAKILQAFQDNPPHGAAMLRNRVCCEQHRTQWIDGLTRVADLTIDDAPEELVALVREYQTRRVDE
ncbi:MAG: CapA family protein [Victivallales bacterium]|nr:CapA family protein [Victivallales bacterium]